MHCTGVSMERVERPLQTRLLLLLSFLMMMMKLQLTARVLITRGSREQSAQDKCQPTGNVYCRRWQSKCVSHRAKVGMMVMVMIALCHYIRSGPSLGSATLSIIFILLFSSSSAAAVALKNQVLHSLSRQPRCPQTQSKMNTHNHTQYSSLVHGLSHLLRWGLSCWGSASLRVSCTAFIRSKQQEDEQIE